MIWLSAVVAMLAATAAPTAAPPQAAQWWVNETLPYCSALGQSQGAGTTFALRTVPGTRKLEFWLVDPPFRGGARFRSLPLNVRFSPAYEKSNQSFFVDSYRGRRALFSLLDDEVLAKLPAADTIQVERGSHALEIRLPSAPTVAAMLRECESKVLRQWGIDPVTNFGLRSAPQVEGFIAAHVSDSDYPADARRAKASGTTVISLDISAEGRVTGCRPVVSSGHASLDNRTCVIPSRRPKFIAAIGADGQPVASAYLTQMRWILP